MGLALYPGSLKEQAGSISANLEQDNRNLLNILSNISQFVSDDALRSEAWTSLKNQLGNHEAVVQGLICANEAVIRANDTMEAAIGSEDLVEDELKDQIQSLERANSGMASIIGSLESCLSSTSVTSVCGSSYFSNTISMYEGWISMNQRQIERLEEKLARLYQIENDTKGLYDEADSLYEAAARGMEAIGKGWNASLGVFEISNGDSEWRTVISKEWSKIQEEIYEKNTIEVPIEFVQQLLGYGKKGIDNHQTINLLINGVRFKINRIGNKYYLQLTGSFLESVMPNKWKNIETFLKTEITDVDWRKVDMKRLVNKGLRVGHPNLQNINYRSLDDYLKIFGSSHGSKLRAAGDTFAGSLTDNIRFWNDFKISNYLGSDISRLNKIGKGLGAAGTILTVGADAYDNLFVDGEFCPTVDGIQDTVTDSAVDLGFSAGSAAAGAAVGSFFAPPIGTAVGVIGGIAVDLAVNTDIFDVDGDGEKDSVVDMAKKGIDFLCDSIGSLFS